MSGRYGNAIPLGNKNVCTHVRQKRLHSRVCDSYEYLIGKFADVREALSSHYEREGELGLGRNPGKSRDQWPILLRIVAIHDPGQSRSSCPGRPNIKALPDAGGRQSPTKHKCAYQTVMPSPRASWLQKSSRSNAMTSPTASQRAAAWRSIRRGVIPIRQRGPVSTARRVASNVP